jgi:hypothetical protein
MKKSLVLAMMLPLVSEAQIRLCDSCPAPPAIDLSLSGDAYHQQFERAFNDHSWLSSDEAALANLNRKVDTILMSINVPILQRFEFMAKIYQVVIADYRAELAQVQLEARSIDTSDDPTGYMHQAKLKLKGKKPDVKAIIAEKQRHIERLIEDRNREMGELAEQVK